MIDLLFYYGLMLMSFIGGVIIFIIAVYLFAISVIITALFFKCCYHLIKYGVFSC